MKRTRLPLLAVFPVIVLSLVLGTPFVFGNHPVRWESGSLLPTLVLDGRPESDPGTGSGTGSPGSADPSAGTSAAPLHVKKVWKEGGPQWGAQIYWEDSTGRSDDFVRLQATKQAAYLIGLGANSVSLSFPFFTDGPTSDTLKAGTGTPTAARVRTVLKVFEDAGFRTTLRPLMDEDALEHNKGWRGNIEPDSRSAWFVSYGNFLAPYLKVAEQTGTDTFVVGTELNSLEGDPGWDTLTDTAAKTFSGDIAYDANWDNYTSGRINMPVGNLGVDAYFPVKVSDTAPVQDLVDGWNQWLDKKATGTLPNITLSEAGIGAMDGAYRAPGDFYNKNALNPKVQATWYTAVCQVVQERKMQGVYWWSIAFEDDPNTAPDDKTASRLDFAGRPLTEKAIKKCFASDYAGPGTGTTD